RPTASWLALFQSRTKTRRGKSQQQSYQLQPTPSGAVGRVISKYMGAEKIDGEQHTEEANTGKTTFLCLSEDKQEVTSPDNTARLRLPSDVSH
ncbi:hypothetical protein ANANG_G00229120, partial [Anguilla anguilla]